MPVQAELFNNTRIFRTDDLFRIRGTWGHLEGVGTCPATVRPWIFFLVAALKMGCREIHAPIWALTKSAFEASAKTTSSASSTRRALAWLVENGYISKRTFRIGADAKGVVIRLNVERFEFFLRPRQTVSTFYADNSTVCDKHPHQSKRPGDKVTNNIDTLVPDQVVISKCIKSKDNAKTKRNHPVLYTLFCVLQKDPNIWRTLAAARAELKNRSESAIDWERFEANWAAMTIPEREYLATAEILPILRQKKSDKMQKKSKNTDLDKIVLAISNGSAIKIEDTPPEYVFDPGYSAEENAALRAAQIKLFWQRKNLKIG